MLLRTKFFTIFRYSRQLYLPLKNINIEKMCSSSIAAPEVKEIISADLVTAEKILNSSNPNTMSEFLYKRFNSERNCYNYVLNLLSITNYNIDVPSQHDMGFEIVLSFNKWLKENSVDESLTLDLKRKALEIAIQKRSNLLVSLVCDVFQIKEHKDIAEETARKLINEEKFEEAANLVIAFSFQESYPLETILIPLILRKSIHTAIRYLCGFSKLQIELAKYLDLSIGELNKNQKMRILGRRVTPRTLYNCLCILVRQYNLPEEQFPNLHKINVNSTLNIFLRQRLEKSLDENTWDNNVMMTIQNNEKLQHKLVAKLHRYGDFDGALKVAKMFNWPPESWPEQGKPQSSSEQYECNEKRITSEVKDYLSLDLDSSNIEFITTQEKFINCLEHISQTGKVVGLDSEWKPFPEMGKVRLSLMQLAVDDKVYILDMLALNSCLSKDDWDSFTKMFFYNREVLKLGCGVIQDVQMYIDDYKGNKDKSICFTIIVDVSVLYQQLHPIYDTDSETSDGSTIGLSKLCDIILGKPLDKTNRIHDWEQRPLTQKQLTYAALDAYCLLQIFNKMKKHAKEHQFNFNPPLYAAALITASMSKNVIKSRMDFKWSRTDKGFCFKPVQNINELKAVLDSPLMDIGMKLRMYGMDVIILDVEDICANSFQVLKDENRILIGSATLREKVKGVLSEDKCFIIQQTILDKKNILTGIFQHFNLHVDRGSMFSRCVRCNQGELDEMSAEELKQLWLNRSSNSSSEEMPKENKLNSVELQIKDSEMDKLNLELFSLVDVFKICSNCGNVQWQR